MSRTPLYTDDLRLAHILADSVDRVSSARFRDRPAYSPAEDGPAIPEEEQKPPWRPGSVPRSGVPSPNRSCRRHPPIMRWRLL